MKSAGDVLKAATAHLESAGIHRARRLAEGMLCHVLGMKRMDLYLDLQKPLTEEELEACRRYLKRLAQHEPPEYIEGVVNFHELELEVSPAVLIPRQETELLVELILQKRGEEPLDLWDICSGSGCIGLSLKKARPKWNVSLSDISPDALSMARKNALKNGLAVEYFEGDLFAPFEGRQADLIVCNPPYVSEEEYESLEPSVKNFEPYLALVGKERGLDFYKRIGSALKTFLKPGGHLFLEIGSSQGESIKEIFAAKGFAKTALLHDLAGLPRHFLLENE